MKILVIGIDSGSPEILFEDARLSNIRHLMGFGCFGVLEVDEKLQKGLEWFRMALGREQMKGEAPKGATIREQIEKQGKRAIVIHVPPGLSYPVKFLEAFNEEFGDESSGDEAGKSLDFDQVKEHVYVQSRRQFDFIRQLMRSEPWDYFQIVDTGLEGLNQARETGSNINLQEAFRDYYLYLDEQVGGIFELLEEDTTVLILAVSSDSDRIGGFILAGATLPLNGKLVGVNPLDIASTLLELGGYEIPGTMQGKSLMAGIQEDTESGLSEDEEAVLRERLSGLGYF